MKTEFWKGFKVLRGRPFSVKRGHQKPDANIFPAYIIGRKQDGSWEQMACHAETPDAVPDEGDRRVADFLREVRPVDQHRVEAM